MPTPTSKDAKQALYAVAGVADLAVSTIRHLPAEAAKMRDRLPDEAVKTYGQLVRRGETLVTGVRRSRPTRQATEAAYEEHRAIYEALRAGDVPAVQRAMDEHMATASARIENAEPVPPVE